MIEVQIGDYVKYKDDILVIKKAYAHSFIGTSLNHKEDYVLGYNDITLLVDYEDYEQQKERADRLEKRWDSLKNFVEKREGISLMVGLTYLKFYVNKLEEDDE